MTSAETAAMASTYAREIVLFGIFCAVLLRLFLGRG